MKTFPPDLIASLQGVAGFDAVQMEQTHQLPIVPVSLRLNPNKPALARKTDDWLPVPWCNTGYYLPERPQFALDPCWHAGAYYVQEASSMFLEFVFNQLRPQLPEKITALDLCAAPGGKSTHLLSLLNPKSDVLVSNEVNQARVSILRENIIKWGAAHSLVTHNDPRDFSTCHGLFNLILVDAPCSGSGLFRKDAQAINEWSPEAVNQCSLRQQRILADILPALAENGYLIYSTCSYSPAENEGIVKWLLEHHDFERVHLPLNLDWKIVETPHSDQNTVGYRFYPYRLKGEGFFLAVLRNRAIPRKSKPSNSPLLPKKGGEGILANWLHQPTDFGIEYIVDTWYAMPPALQLLFNQLRKKFHIKKAGIQLGQSLNTKFSPAHELAMFPGVTECRVLEVNSEQALAYLRKLPFELTAPERGWYLIRFQNCHLGWINHLGNRFNNYYPTDWRLRLKG